jgi:hypothetical protein
MPNEKGVSHTLIGSPVRYITDIPVSQGSQPGGTEQSTRRDPEIVTAESSQPPRTDDEAALAALRAQKKADRKAEKAEKARLAAEDAKAAASAASAATQGDGP